MKPKILLIIPAFLCLLLFSIKSYSQSFGTLSSATWLSDCNQSNFYNTSGNPADLPGPAGNVFTNANFGVHTQNSGTLILRGAEVRTFKGAVANVCSVRMYYRIYLVSAVPGAFTSIDLPKLNDCVIPSGQFPSGGPCATGDQKWNRVIPDGTTIPYAPVNLTSFVPGNYTLEVYYDVTGSSTTTTLCDETILLDNGGANYKAFFSIQGPDMASNNPTTCNGTEGLITINGLVAGETYSVSYEDDGTPVGPANMVANGSGQILIIGLNAGVYSNFELLINGCTTNLFTGITLSNPVFTPTFPNIPPFCAGTTPVPTLPTTSLNGIIGTWNPAVIRNDSTATYRFTPTSGTQCGLTFTRTVTVIQKATPTFSFGNTLSICRGAAVPPLLTTSINNFTGSWSPSAIDNQNSATYTFTPNTNQCANPKTLTVTVNPILTTTFGFGTTLTICAGQSVPALPPTSSNGIAGTWSPASVDNQNSGTYNFTPNVGQCGTPATFDVTVNPNIAPTFSFSTTLTICIDETVPALPGTSDNGITGTWNPAVVSNQASATYTFTPTPGLCAFPATFTVTVNPKITPAFSFGTSLTICAGAAVPALPITSTNNINGTWSPATIDDQNSATYTFTPDIGECATPTSLNVTVNPILTTTFSFGTALTICAGQAVPVLPNTSSNNIAGVWSPASVDNQNSDTYTFTPNPGQCGTTVNFTVTVNPNLIPTFSFGTSLSICTGGTVPALLNTSDNAITGTWNPTVVSDQASATYTFTPTPGLCAVPATLTVTVTPNETPTFSFGTTLTICAGETVPALPTTSDNAITGTWNPASVDDQTSATYTFTPTAGCATTATFTVTVNPNITPTFSFGTAQTYCVGATVPALPGTSVNGITGTWNTASVDNLNSAIYTFTPTPGLCATTATFTVTINPVVVPTFSFGTTLTICAGGAVPALPPASDNGISGTWNVATVDDQNSATYTFTPTSGLCANPATFSVTVNPNITPTFSFGTTLTVCAGGTVPSLPGASDNGIAGAWDIATVDDQNSGVYTFTPTPAPGLCATIAIFTVTINSNITPTFSFGTAQTYCESATVPALPTTSIETINGTWSPSSVDNQNSAVYTFTPAVGECAIATTFTVTITPNETPIFSFGTTLTICAGGAVPPLPSTSDNGISGTWNVATVDNQNSATYTFTPTPGLCALPATFVVTVNPIITPTFNFGTAQTYCAGAIVPALPGTSDNGIAGTWDITIVDDQNSAVYTFTPTPAPGLCATTAIFTVTINSNITPTFSFGTAQTYCELTTVPALPTISIEAINGTWSPSSVDNQNSGVYTFTPAVGECAIATTFTVTITPNETPTFSFGTALTICAGGTVPPLPNTSDNGISGTWNVATVDDQNSATYTFTPAPGVCAIPATFAVTVNPIVTPTFSFGTALTICAGGTVPALPNISANGINGVWDIVTVDDQNSNTYTFTPTVGECAITATFTVTVNPNITPTFSFGTAQTYCAGTTVPTLPTTSNEAITGTWSPASIDNQNSGVYTFTPAVGECAVATTFTVTITPNETPIFSFGTTLNICAGGTVPPLPNTSDNGISGTWNVATVDNQNSATYTFTPSAGLCAIPVTFAVTVNPNITPTFIFGTAQTYCAGATVPALPGISENGINGTWDIATVDNQNSATYTFTPTAGVCATTATFIVTVNPVLTTTFSIGTDLTICSGNTVPALASVSDNGISGTWSPETIDNQASGVYTFTPATGQCGTTATFTVTVTPSITPTFNFGPTLTICKGSAAPVLPPTSDNGYDGVWTPAVVSNQDTAVYTFTPTTAPALCVTTITLKVNVNPVLTPTFSFGTTLSICSGATVPPLPTTSANNITGTWNPAVVSNQASGVYTFTSTAGQCATPAVTYTVTVTPTPSVNALADITANDDDIIPVTTLSGTPAGVSYSWTNSNTAIGLAASGTGNISSFTGINRGNDPISATITVTPSFNGCTGAAKTNIITIRSLNKDVFVPNVFSPNGDGKNDVLFVYGNYIQKLDMRIFNQWGEQVEQINVKTKGWDGSHRGKQQPVGVYVYVLQAELLDGRKVNLKGSITLVR